MRTALKLMLLSASNIARTIYDTFSTAIAGGSVNGTSAESGTRVVVDTYNTVDLVSTTNPGFETAGAGGADVFGSWVEDATNTTITRDTGTFHGGAASAKLVAGASNPTGSIYLSINVIQNQTYQAKFWVQGDGTNAPRYKVWDSNHSADIIAVTSTGVTAASWTQVTVNFTTPAGCDTARLYFYAPATNGGFGYFDDVTCFPTGYLVSNANGKAVLTGSGTGEQVKLTYTPTVIRQAGLVERIDFNNVDNCDGRMGFRTNTTAISDFDNNGIQFGTAQEVLARRTTTGGSLFMMTSVANNEYPVRQILRNTGRYILIKGVDSIIRFRHMDEWSNASPLSAGMTAVTRNKTLQFDNVGIPTSLFYAIQSLASDSFNRADGAIGSTDGAGHAEANSGSGLAWTNQVGTYTIATNKAASSTLSGGSAIATVDSGTIHVYIRVKATRSAGNVGVVLRYVDANNYIRAYHDGTNAVLEKVVAGTPTSVISAAATYSAGAYITVICDGAVFELQYNEVRIGTGGTIADAGLQTSTLMGLYSTNAANTFDDFVLFAERGYADIEAY